MPETGINYCDRTWNVVAGCEEASEGCRHCWARRTANRLAGHPSRDVREVYAGLTERRGREEALAWTGIVRTLPERLEEPLDWRSPQRVFVDSMSDLFHPAVPDEFIARVFVTMAAAPQHSYLVLTKRPRRMHALLTDGSWWARVRDLWFDGLGIGACGLLPWPWPHVHLGITAENQQRLEERVPDLLQTPAAVHWLSLEPLLGAVEVARSLQCEWEAEAVERHHPVRGDTLQRARIRPRIDLVIVGGESGGPPERRLVERCVHPFGRIYSGPAGSCITCGGTGWAPKPEALAWVRALRDQCAAGGISFYFKGWGGPRATSGEHLLDGRMHEELPEID